MAVIDRERWRVLQPLLDRALDLTDPEREVWLEELRAGSPETAAELTAILSGERVADRSGFLIQPLQMSLEGLEVGAYTLERPLGDGGMGTVWLARRTDGRFEGRSAVKLLNLSLLTATGQERFRREGTVLARLAHPGIARLLDAGVATTRQPYLVIEYVDGQPIDTFVAARGLSGDERIGLVLQVLDAVGHAHANLIIHRDLKPSNILVTTDGTVKLLDFGIAKLLDSDADGERTALTAEGSRALTPEYAAPEQVRGEAITTATDVYASGVLLYLLLSGRHPTAAASRTPAEVIQGVLEVEPPKLGLGDLDTILGKALRKAPNERYQTAGAFADDLRRYLRHEPVSARPDSLVYRGRKFVRRNRVMVMAAATTAAALIAATAFSVRQMQNAQEQRDDAVRDSRRALAMSELQGVFAGDTRDPDGRPLSAADRIALTERVLVRQFRGEPWLVTEVMADLAGRFYEAGDREAQRRMLARARAIARQANLPAQVALADCLRASSFWYDDQNDSARIELAEAKAELARPAARADGSVEGNCLRAEGEQLLAAGHSDSGVVLLQRALSVMERERGGTDHLSLMASLAQVLRLGSRMREAVPYERRMLAGLDSLGRAETEAFPIAVTYLTGSLWDLGEMASADSAMRAFVAAREAVDGAGRVPSILALQHGRAKLAMGDLDSADLWIARAMRDTTADVGWVANWTAVSLAELRLGQGRPAEARQPVARLPGGTPGRRATAAMLRSRLRRAEGDTAGAASFLESELAALANQGRKPEPFYALPLVTAGEWRLARGDARGADSLAQRARAAAAVDSLALSRSGLVGRAELLRARTLRAMGDMPSARDAARRATVALASGYGGTNRWTLAARALLDSLAR